MNIYEKIQLAKQMILESNLKKSGRNSFAGYTYYELSDILPRIIEVCNELKMFTMINFHEDVATLDIVNVEEPKEIVQYVTPLKELQLKGANAIQALGGTQTYLRRYLYMNAFDIIENDMFDSMPPAKEEKPAPPKDVPASKEIIEKMNKAVEMYAKKVGKDVTTAKGAIFKKMKLDEATLTEAQAQAIIDRVVKNLSK